MVEFVERSAYLFIGRHMHLLDLSTEAASLEFSPDERAFVMTRLRDFGPVSIENAATYDVISVGLERFTYMNEWDEPCLIAGSRAGKAILATLAHEADLSTAAE